MKLGLCSVLFIVLLVLKLCAVITIGWLWVFMPLIVMAVFWFAIVMLFLVVFISKCIKELKDV